MATLIARHAHKNPQRAALIDERGELSWATLDDRVNRLINAFGALGLGVGDHIAIYAGNRREYYELMAACAHTGIMFVPVNWHFTAEELAYVIGNSESKALFVAEPFLATAAAAVARGETPTLRRCIAIGGSIAGFDDYEALLAGSSNEAVEGKFLGGPMFYTSGTTGRPKGVRSASRGGPPPLEMIEMMGAGLTAMLSIPADGVTLICGPVYHSAQWAFSFLPMIAGSTTAFQSVPSSKRGCEDHGWHGRISASNAIDHQPAVPNGYSSLH